MVRGASVLPLGVVLKALGLRGAMGCIFKDRRLLRPLPPEAGRLTAGKSRHVTVFHDLLHIGHTALRLAAINHEPGPKFQGRQRSGIFLPGGLRASGWC